MDRQDIAKFCSLGFGGHCIEYERHCHLTGYQFSVEEIAEHHASELTDGVLCLDKRPALERNTAYAFASPMVNVDLADGEVDRIGIDHIAEGGIMVDALKQTAYGPIIKAAEIAAEVAPDVAGPLDYVPISQYVEWWVSRGALLYRYDAGAAKFVQVK